MKPIMLGKDVEADEEEAPKSSPRGFDDSEDDAAADMIQAVKDGDAKAFSMAFARAYEACAGKHDEADEEEY